MNKFNTFSGGLRAIAIAAFAYNSAAFADVVVDIDLTQPEHHYANVSLSLNDIEQQQIDLHLPIWRTGRYEVLNLANGIREFSASSNGSDLSWQKIDKDTWRISGDLSQGLTVNYQVYANQLGKRTRHVDDSHAFIDASSVVMYADEKRNDKHIINLNVPEDWRSVSGLETGSNSHQFVATDYDLLVDSPIETGINDFYQFEVDGRQYELVIWGKGNYNTEQMLTDLKKLVTTGETVWDNYPFKRYVFMVHATSGARGATEHINSTIIQRSRYKFDSREDYLGFISTAAHEFVHTWNVKQYRPEGLVPYNYQAENYSNLLWLSEGSTSYLQNQLLMRGDIITANEWLSILSKRVSSFLRTPGRKAQSVAESSFDKWISEGGDYGKNHSVNIYSEGFIVSWMLDIDLLAKSRLKKSYRDVHKVLSNEYAIPKTFNDQDVKNVLKQVSGRDYSDWWAVNVDGYLQPNFEKLLDKAGLKITYGKAALFEGKGKSSSRKSSKNAKVKTKAWTGISTKKHESGLLVTSVEKDSPAWQAGLTTDDVLIALDGLRITGKDLTERMKNFAPKQTISVSLFRRDQLIEKAITLGSLPKDKLKIVPVDKPSRKQKAFFKAWTGLNLPNA